MKVPEYTSSPEDQRRKAAHEFLKPLLNKNLRITTTDDRMFWGAFMCTDPESNVILQHTYEYRQPSPQKVAEITRADTGHGKVKVDMISRFLGLVVVPGKHIVRIEVEEFASQLR